MYYKRWNQVKYFTASEVLHCEDGNRAMYYMYYKVESGSALEYFH